MSSIDQILAVLPAVQADIRADIAARHAAGENIGRVAKDLVLASRESPLSAKVAISRDIEKARNRVEALLNHPDQPL